MTVNQNIFSEFHKLQAISNTVRYIYYPNWRWSNEKENFIKLVDTIFYNMQISENEKFFHIKTKSLLPDENLLQEILNHNEKYNKEFQIPFGKRTEITNAFYCKPYVEFEVYKKIRHFYYRFSIEFEDFYIKNTHKNSEFLSINLSYKEVKIYEEINSEEGTIIKMPLINLKSLNSKFKTNNLSVNLI
jgi:hypothetical protein